MKLFFCYLMLFFSLFSFFNQKAQASCDVGPVLFQDTLYGAGIGTGIGALVLLANSSSNNIAPTLAASALAGIGTGLVVGVVELSLSDCAFGKASKNSEASHNSHFHLEPLVALWKEPSFPENRPQFKVTKDNKFIGGLTLEYDWGEN